jgi:flagellar basal-body rod protein FlgF
VASGSLEGSNVNPVETLIKLIDISRHYEIHSNFIKNLSEQATTANKLLDIKS